MAENEEKAKNWYQVLNTLISMKSTVRRSNSLAATRHGASTPTSTNSESTPSRGYLSTQA